MSLPFVSVVTPFHNTEAYLAQCIESVLAQTYSNFEYILVDNCSTDASGRIAEEYARRDSRIRVIRRSQLLSQVRNYNRALAEISGASRYCKVVQADDFIFPDCLKMMVDVLERSNSIGLVSSYWLKGNEVRGSEYPYPAPMLPGKEMARLYLRKGTWVFGSPTAVMYRSCLIEKDQPFYDEAQLHEDSDKCMQILKSWDFGFVHQVLSFSRADNESISFAARSFQPVALDRYIMVCRNAASFLDSAEADALIKETRRNYYRALAKEALRGRKKEFWDYQKKGLKTLGENLDRAYLAARIVGEVLWNLANPGAALSKLFRPMKGQSVSTKVREDAAAPQLNASLKARTSGQGNND